MKPRLFFILPLALLAWAGTACGSLNSSSYGQVISPPSTAPQAAVAAPDPRRAAWISEAENLKNADIIQQGMVSNKVSQIGSDVVVKGDVAGSVSVIGGNLYLLGEVDGSVAIVGGNATITGTVNGPVNVLGGNLRVAGRITGNASALGGRIEQTPGSKIEGNTTAQGSWSSLSHRSHAADAWYSIKGALSIWWIGASMLAALLMPRVIEEAAQTLPGSALKSGAVGILYFVVAFCFLIISILLCFFLIGIPMLGLLMLVALGLKWFGYTVIFLWVGQAICRQLDWSAGSIFLPILAGGFALSLLRFIPIFGLVFWFVLGLIADGMTILVLFQLQRVRYQPLRPPPIAA